MEWTATEWERSSSATTSRSTESSRTRSVTKASRAGGWVGLIKDRPELARITLEEARSTDAMLMGRRTYEWFAGRWPSRTGELADRLNGLPKYVVSSTLEHLAWNNSTILEGDLLAAVSTLKQEFSGAIVIPASVRIVRTLMEHDLVDAMRLKVFPSCSAPATASSARPAPRGRCASSTSGPSTETPRTSRTSVPPRNRSAKADRPTPEPHRAPK